MSAAVTPAMATPTLELGLSISDPRHLAQLAGEGPLLAPAVAAFLGDAEVLALLPADCALSHLYFGSEFCEHLLPDAAELARALKLARQRALRLVLATPVANDTLLERLAELLPLLPAGSEVLANDWGVASLVHRDFPGLRVVAGRQLSKMIKDPRLPGEQWAQLYPAGFRAERQLRILHSLGIERIELDVPPFAGSDFFASPGVTLALHAPYAYVAKGRLCKVGSLAQPAALKFAPGGACRRECLGVVEVEGGQPGQPGAGGKCGASRNSLRTAQRGTTMFYRYDAALLAAAAEAVRERRVSRLVLSSL
jgi:hypothetical protein